MTISKLIAALERADGPSRELDAEIAGHAGWVLQYQTQFWPPAIVAKMRRQKKSGYHFGRPEIVPAFSSSLDAALTLVPEDAHWTVSVPTQPDMSGKPYWATVRARGPTGSRGMTPAIALCAAALKARA